MKPLRRFGQFSSPSAELSGPTQAVPRPDCDAAGQDALDGGTVEVHQDV